MLRILTVSRDYSCDRLQEWMAYLKKPMKRYCLDKIHRPNISLPIEKKSKIYSRKFSIPSSQVMSNVDKYLNKELRAYWFEFFESIEKENLIGTGRFDEPSRLLMLTKADKSGFLVPKYLLTTQKNEILSFMDRGYNVITKPLRAPNNIIEGDNDIAFRTSLLELDDVKLLDDTFHPTFFQQYIEREIEVRMFFFFDKFWALAFIVKKENYATDIWNVKIRREVPINIPKNILRATNKFKNLTGFSTGSIDFIINNGVWYFLEINPNGQYDFLVKSCNYSIDKEIAKSII